MSLQSTGFAFLAYAVRELQIRSYSWSRQCPHCISKIRNSFASLRSNLPWAVLVELTVLANRLSPSSPDEACGIRVIEHG